MNISMNFLARLILDKIEVTLARHRHEYLSELRLTEAILRSDIDQLRCTIENLPEKNTMIAKHNKQKG